MSLDTYDNVISYDANTGGVGVGTSSDYLLLLDALSTNPHDESYYYYQGFNGSYYAFSFDSGIFTIYATQQDWEDFITEKRTEVTGSNTMTDREVIVALGLEGGIL